MGTTGATGETTDLDTLASPLKTVKEEYVLANSSDSSNSAYSDSSAEETKAKGS